MDMIATTFDIAIFLARGGDCFSSRARRARRSAPPLPPELQLELLRVLAALVLDAHRRVRRDGEALVRDLDRERLALLERVREPAELLHELRAGGDPLDVPCRTLRHDDLRRPRRRTPPRGGVVKWRRRESNPGPKDFQ